MGEAFPVEGMGCIPRPDRARLSGKMCQLHGGARQVRSTDGLQALAKCGGPGVPF